MWQLASFVTSGENGQHCVKVGHAVTPRFFPLDVCATAKKKGPTVIFPQFHLLLHSLSFRVGAIIFAENFSPRSGCSSWPHSPFQQKQRLCRKNFRHFHRPRVTSETIRFPWVFFYFCVGEDCTLHFKQILIHFSEMKRLLRQRHLPLAGKLVTIFVICPQFLIQVNLSKLLVNFEIKIHMTLSWNYRKYGLDCCEVQVSVPLLDGLINIYWPLS